MRYDRVVEGRFISRPNRFIAEVEIGGKYRVPYDARELLTDREFTCGSEIEVKPYDVLVLERK